MNQIKQTKHQNSHYKAQQCGLENEPETLITIHAQNLIEGLERLDINIIKELISLTILMNLTILLSQLSRKMLKPLTKKINPVTKENHGKRML